MSVIDWRKVVCLIYVSSNLFVVAPNAGAVDQSQLWLPRNYYRHFKSLYQAAEIAEKTERCRYVIAGTISQGRSSNEHPIFKITCRDEERQTFAWIVDGLSHQILNLPAPPNPEEIEQEKFRERLAEKWSSCSKQLSRRVKGLKGVTWETQEMPEPEIVSETDFRFSVSIKAMSSTGRMLRYQGDCHFLADGKDVNIYPWLETKEPEIALGRNETADDNDVARNKTNSSNADALVEER